MIEFFPPPEGGWRASEALLSMARLREAAFDFNGALKSYADAYARLKFDEESRLRAFEGKLRVHAFLRDFEGAARTAESYLVDFPRAEGSASAMRALLRYETLAGHAAGARERARRWDVKGGLLGAGEMSRVIAGALADLGQTREQLALLDEIAQMPGVKIEERVRAGIESAIWRAEFERRKVSAGGTSDPAVFELACKSMRKAVELLPSGKNAAVGQLTADAEQDLKDKKYEQAARTYWGAALLALLGSDAETAYYFALNKSYPLALPLKDKNNGEFKDPAQFRDAAWELLREKCGDAVWGGKWRAVAFKRGDLEGSKGANGPESNSDARTRYGERGWAEIDPESDKSERTEYGFDVRRFSGDGQVVYLAREFDMPATLDTVLQLSDCGAWTAWIDGQLRGRDIGAEEYKVEADRIPMRLEKGRHRLLVKLEVPAEGAALFRARVGVEPQLAMALYIQALVVRSFPASTIERAGDLGGLRDALARRSSPEAMLGFAQALCQMYDDQKWFALEQMTRTAQQLRDLNQDALSVSALRDAFRRLEDGSDYQGRSQKILELSRALARALVHEGDTAQADAVLREATNKYPIPAADNTLCLAWRGALRRDLGQSQAALPFFERCAREGLLGDDTRQLVGPGLEWARLYRPERIVFESSRDVQAQLDGVRRQLDGAPEELGKAMKGLSEILRNTSNALVKVAESPFAARYVGVREYIRGLLESFTPAQREAYRKAVGEAAAQRLLRVPPNDPALLESAALEFPLTAESHQALNRAANLYLDRGNYGQAISIFQMLLREEKHLDNPALMLAKLASALASNGQRTEADAALKLLAADYPTAQINLNGESVSGAALAGRLKAQRMTQSGNAVPGVSVNWGGYMGGLARSGMQQGPAPEPGGVAWVQPAIGSAALDSAKSLFGAESQLHLQSHPATDGTRVFVGTMESLRAFELQGGGILWTQTWSSGALNSSGAFTGFPSSCPAVGNGIVYVRAQAGLSALKAFDAVSGEPRWSSEMQPELRKLMWISDPALAYGMVFAAYLEPGDFNAHGVAALDAETGRLRWRTELANGTTGIKTGEVYYQAAYHMGPPAVDAGEVYVETGLSSMAALNAFSGEARWVSSYPRMQLGDLQRGVTNVYDFSTRSFKVFSRGPLPPMVQGDSIVAAPLDACGVMAFDRRDGSLRWQREMVDARYVAGVAGGNILACDDGVTALDAATGATAWHVEFEGESLLGEPALSGNVLYFPSNTGLKRLNALSGVELGSTPWDARVGPGANALVTTSRIVLVGEHAVIALDAAGAGAKALPLYEARQLEREGKFDEAAQRYAALLSNDKESLPAAAASYVRMLKKLGKRDEALAEVARLEREAPANLSALGGLWTTRRDALVRSLRRSLGEAVPDAVPAPADQKSGLAGVLAYSYFMQGEDPLAQRFTDDPPGRMYVRMNDRVQCLRIGATSEVIWSAYVGTNVKKLAAGESFLAALSDRDIAVLDRESGEVLSHIVLTNQPLATGKDAEARNRRRRDPRGEAFAQLCVHNKMVFTLSEARLCAWDAQSGQQLWSRTQYDERPVANGLSAHDNVLVRIYNRKEDVLVTAYDAATGTEIQTIAVERQQHVTVSPDGHYMLARSTGRVACVDLRRLAIVWRKEAEFDPNFVFLDFTPENQVRYGGADRNNYWRQTIRYLDPATGNDAVPAQADGSGNVETGMFVFAERGQRISRMRPPGGGGGETLWTLKLPYQSGSYYFLQTITAGSFVHMFWVHTFDNGSREQLFLRTLNLETGEQIVEQALPGSPVFGVGQYGGRMFKQAFVKIGGALVYTAREGIYVLRAPGLTPLGAIEKLREEIREPGTSAEQVKELRRGLASLAAPESMAFVVPADARVDGDLSEWKSTDPIALTDRTNYVPLSANAPWGGTEDLSAKIYAGWNQEGLTVAVDVADNKAAPPRAGMETSSGDRVRIVLDTREGEYASLEAGESFVATLALGGGGSVFTQEFGTTVENGPKPEGKAAASVSGTGRQYEFFVPWTVLRKTALERSRGKREIRMGVAIYDDDGTGANGALEWGAGTTMPGTMPMWLGRVALIDVSAEKIERYRKVIEMVPGSAEALKFLRLILLSKRGPDADAERAQELEKFVTEHPACANTLKALALLREAYRKVGEQDVDGRMEKLMQKAKVPEPVRKALGAAFKLWVYPDPRKPPQTIMVQFSNGNFEYGGSSRAYWGAPLLTGGRRSGSGMQKLGELPPAGKWTELRVSPLEFDLENMEIKAFALGASGGTAYFDRLSYTVGDQETVLLDDKMPQNWTTQRNDVKFVDEPKHDGAKSMTFANAAQADGLYNTYFIADNWQPIMSFAGIKSAEPPERNTARRKELYRKAAQLISDTPDGFAFLRRAIDLNEGDETQRSKTALAEIKDFMKINAVSSNAYEALKLAREYLVRKDAPEPMEKYDEFIRDVKPTWTATRAFYADFVPAWTEWNILGPFPALGERRGMEMSTESERAVDLSFKTQVGGRELAWKKISNANKNGEPVVDLKTQFHAERESERGPYFGYAYTKFNCPTKRKVLFAYGAEDAISIWVNGKRVVNEQYTYAQKDKETIEVQLRSGENEVLIKVGVQRGRLAFVFRIADLDGKPFADIKNE